MKKLSLILFFLIPLFPLMALGAESICLEGNCVSGNGVMLYGGGEKYAGDFKEGKRQGHGILTAKNGKRYEGDWANDLQNGQGTLISPNGEKYIGAFKDGVKQGEGQLAFPNGEVYTGAFDRGEPSGRGVHAYPTGEKYEGEFKNSLYDGKGTQTFPDGRKYVGEFSKGIATGMGTLTLANGEKYEGEFADGMGNGKGTYFFPGGTTYEGEWKDFRYHGHGSITFSDGSHYAGEFRNGKREGIGIITFKDGETYEGGWKDDKKHGFGILITSTGEKYEGIWKEDKFIKYSKVTPPSKDFYTYSEKGDRKNKIDFEPEVISGTAFFINSNGHLVTNHHVISDCRKIHIKSSKVDSVAHVVIADKINDLGIIKSDKSYGQYAKLKGTKGVRAGEDIVVVGYPLGPILGETIKVTTGNISSLTGLANDTSIMQISAPIQPGSSGGPVLDMSGNVVGVVSSKLNELAVAKLTGSLSQNINFAIKSSTLQIFLDTHEIDYEFDNSEIKLETAEIVGKAQDYTVSVTCSH